MWVAWTFFGFASQLAFAATAALLFWFLSGVGRPAAPVGAEAWLWRLVLAVQFGVVHSLLLHPAVRRRIERRVPEGLYGCFFCATTCTSVLAVIVWWGPSGRVIWDWSARPMGWLPYLVGWGLLGYSIWLSGAGFQTGWTPFWGWLTGQPKQRPPFRVRGLYRWMRHPIYLSFLVILWTPPVFTSDRLLLNVVWTAYVFVGSYLKDRRLTHYLGEAYLAYRRRVPGYPLLGVGPLGRLS